MTLGARAARPRPTPCAGRPPLGTSSGRAARAPRVVLLLALLGAACRSDSATPGAATPTPAPAAGRAHPSHLFPAAALSDPKTFNPIITTDATSSDILREVFDTLVRLEAAFAVGLIGDTAGIRILMERFQNEPYLDAASALEAITSLARVGGPVVGEFFRAALEGRFPPGVRDPVALRNRVAFESWRLGDEAPISSLLPLAADQESNMRWHAVYSLARLRAPEAAGQLSLALRDEVPIIRSAAVRGLVPEVVDRDDAKCPHGCERAHFGAAQVVLLIADGHGFAVEAAR